MSISMLYVNVVLFTDPSAEKFLKMNEHVINCPKFPVANENVISITKPPWTKASHTTVIFIWFTLLDVIFVCDIIYF